MVILCVFITIDIYFFPSLTQVAMYLLGEAIVGSIKENHECILKVLIFPLILAHFIFVC